MHTAGNSAFVTQLNLWTIAGHRITLRRENESDSSSDEGKMKFKLGGKQDTPMHVCGVESRCPQS